MKYTLKATLLMLAGLLASACAPKSSIEQAYGSAGSNTFAGLHYTRSIISSNDF